MDWRDALKALHPHPALMIYHGERSYLVVADLHIGFEERYSSKGIGIKASTERMATELDELLTEHRPDKLLILGDLKYSVQMIMDPEWAHIPELLERLMLRVKITVIPGNHDGGLLPLLPRRVELLDVHGVKIGENGLFHGHTTVPESFKDCKRIIMGHVHPTFAARDSPLSGSPVWIIMKTDARILFPDLEQSRSIELITMPAFNRELYSTGYVPYRERSIAPTLRRVKDKVEEAYIMTLGGEIIGDSSLLTAIL